MAQWTQVSTCLSSALRIAATAMSLFAAPVIAQVVPAEKYGDLFFVPYADPVTHKDLSFVVADDLTETVMRAGGMLWACDGNRITVIFEPDLPVLTNGETGTVQWQFDATPLQKAQWSFGPERLTLLAPTPVVPSFLEASRGSTRLTMLIIDGSATHYTYRFSLRGFAEASVRLACMPGNTGDHQHPNSQRRIPSRPRAALRSPPALRVQRPGWPEG